MTPRPRRPHLTAPAATGLAAVALVLTAVVVIAIVGGRDGTAGAAMGTAAPTAVPSAAESVLPATPAPSATPSRPARSSPRPTPAVVFAATNGIPIPRSQAYRATRRPVTVMVDDHPRARPQAGFATADIVYQALAEGGVPRYMLVFQSRDAPRVGPIRSSRLYFVRWAAEWRSIHARVGGSPQADTYLRMINRRLVWDADEMDWSPSRYFTRSRARRAPHNTYATTANLRALGVRLGARGTFTRRPWTFIAQAPLAKRPSGGSLTVPYQHNRIGYRYDRATNRYLRSTSRERAQRDAATGARVAPSNVIVVFTHIGPLAGRDNREKMRIFLRVAGRGRALVLRNGQVIDALWRKPVEEGATFFTYAGGCNAGRPVGLVRGQIFIQVVSTPAPVRVSGPRPGPEDCAAR